MLKGEAERLNALAQGILSLARLERDAASGMANFATADISELVRDAVESLRVQAKEKGVEIRLSAPESCVAVCDGQMISRAVSNLVQNAVLHSGSDEVFVSVSSSGKAVLIVVEDHGVGIPPEDCGRVFDRFYRVDRSRNSSTGGSGLGLAISRGIARLHGGDVALEIVEPSGCRFSIALPTVPKLDRKQK
jgi:signal transduction histidine kinase